MLRGDAGGGGATGGGADDDGFYPHPVLWTRDDKLGEWRRVEGWRGEVVDGENGFVDGPGGGRAGAGRGRKRAAMAMAPAPGRARAPGRRTLSPPPAPPPAADASVAEADVGADAGDGSVRQHPALARLMPSLVGVRVVYPAAALPDGVPHRSFCGVGLVVHHDPSAPGPNGAPGGGYGLVLVDRATVVVSPGDVRLDFLGGATSCGGWAPPREAAGRCVFLHPQHNLALIRYDIPGDETGASGASADGGDAAVSGASVPWWHGVRAAALDPRPVAAGEETALVSLAGVDTGCWRPLVTPCTVVDSAAPAEAGNAQASVAEGGAPRFRAIHEEGIRVDRDLGPSSPGVLCCPRGGVRALWACYQRVDRSAGDEDIETCMGMPAAVFGPWLARAVLAQEAAAAGYDSGPLMASAALGAECEATFLGGAAEMGLPPTWAAVLAARGRGRNTVLRVRSTVAGAACRGDGRGDGSHELHGGDLLLAVDGEPVASVADLAARIRDRGAAAARLPDVCTARGWCALVGLGPKSIYPASNSARTTALASLGRRLSLLGSSVALATSPAVPAASTASSSVPLPADVVAATRSGDAPWLTRPPDADNDPRVGPVVRCQVLRDGAVREVSFALTLESALGTVRLLQWSGALFQAAHRGVLELGMTPEGALDDPREPGGVFVSRYHYGSPAQRYGLSPLRWVVAVDGKPTPTLSAFADAVGSLPHRAPVALRTINLQGRAELLTLRVDSVFWGGAELRSRGVLGGWRRCALGAELTEGT